MFSYNSVIDSFAPRAPGGTLESKLLFYPIRCQFSPFSTEISKFNIAFKFSNENEKILGSTDLDTNLSKKWWGRRKGYTKKEEQQQRQQQPLHSAIVAAIASLEDPHRPRDERRPSACRWRILQPQATRRFAASIYNKFLVDFIDNNVDDDSYQVVIAELTLDCVSSRLWSLLRMAADWNVLKRILWKGAILLRRRWTNVVVTLDFWQSFFWRPRRRRIAAFSLHLGGCFAWRWRPWFIIADALAGNTTMDTLDIHHIHITPVGLDDIARSLDE